MNSQHSAVVNVAVRADARVGEGPVWRAETSSLLWVDIPRGEVHESVLSSSTTTTRRIPESLGAVALTGSDDLLLACRSGFATLHDDRFLPWAAFLGEADRMNDAKCDPAGRFWAGSTAIDFTPGRGALHVLEADGAHRVAVDGLILPNGLDWGPAGDVFYLADTYRHEISAWDYDVTDGALTNRRLFASFNAGDGMPDGLTTDADGCLWVAMWGGHRVIRLDPAGKAIQTIDMPVAQPSSCTFGGPDLDTLFVTSAAEGLQFGAGALDGSVFAIAGLRTQGLPVSRFGVGRSG